MIIKALEILSSGTLIPKPLFKDILDNILKGDFNDIQKAAFLGALSCYDLPSDYLLVAVLSLQDQMLRVDAPKDAVDCCGTGGDASVTGGSLNISTAVAFMAARSGLVVAKHGNRAVSSKSGSADVLEEIGYDIKQTPQEISKQLIDTHLSFLFAPYFHPALKHMAHIRKSMGIKTFFNLLGPLLNPARVKYQLMGVYDFALADKMLDVLEKTGTKCAMIIHSASGEDELTLFGDNYYKILLKNGERLQGVISYKDVGLPQYPLDALCGGDVGYNAQELKALLEGTTKNMAYFHTVIFNLGALLYVSGKATSIKDGVLIALDHNKLN